jgi:hypothetical protein
MIIFNCDSIFKPLKKGWKMAANRKLLFTLPLLFLLLFTFSQNSRATVYEWKDFTQPFIKRFQIGGKTEIKVVLPESLLEKNTKIALIIEHTGMGDDGNGIQGGFLRINDQSIFGGYRFGVGEKTTAPVRLYLNTQYFRPGLNVLHLAPFFTGGYRGIYYYIKELRFDIQDIQQFRPVSPEQPAIYKTEKDSVKPSIAKTPIDETPPQIIITSHDIARGVKLVQEHKKAMIKGKVVDESSIVEVLVDDKEVLFDQDGNFSAEVYLGYGENRIVISAKDRYENRAIQKITILRRASSPSAVPQKAKATAGKYFALLIGNNNYKYLRKLSTAKKDAEKIGTILKHSYGFDIKVLLDATRNDIVRALNSFRKKLRQNDSFLIYYAGHGEFDKVANKAYWLPVDARSDEDTNWIIVDTVTSNIKRIPSRHILVISDSCYSGTFTRRAVTELVSDQERRRYLNKMLSRRSRTLLASGGNEPVSDIGGQGHSVFARALIKGLAGIDHREFSAEELYYQYIKEMVAGGSEQTPEYNIIRNSGHEGGDFVFKRLD